MPATANRRRHLVLTWQELLDGKSRIGGYLLQPQALRTGDDISGTELLIALESEDVARFAARRIMIVPMTMAQWDSADFGKLLCGSVMFLAEESVPATNAELVGKIRLAGGKVALRLADGNPCAKDAGLLMVDFKRTGLPALEETIRKLRSEHPALIIVADGVDSWAEHRLCQSIGIAFSIGNFATTTDESSQSDGLTPSRLVLLEMIRLLRTDGAIGEIVEVAKRDPAIVIQLLNLANSSFYGLPRAVQNLDDVVLLLGRDALYQWLAVALFKVGAHEGRDETLLAIALGRAFFLEDLAAGKHQAGDLFLVGLLSLVDCLLGRPIEAVLEHIPLSPDVSAVLLRSEGPYARYLLLALAMQNGRLDQAKQLAEGLGLDPVNVAQAYSKATVRAVSSVAENSAQDS